MPEVEISVNATGFGHIKLDGVPIAGVYDIDLYISAGNIPRLSLKILPDKLRILLEDAELTAEVVEIDEDTLDN